MKRRIGIILGAIFLVALGFVVGLLIIKPNTVVLTEAAARTVPAAFVSDQSDIPSLQAFNDAFVKIAEAVTPSVVTITTEKVIKTGRGRLPGFPEDDFFWQFFGFPQGEMRSTALGSGVIVDDKGYILTNNHVVEKGEKIKVKLIDKSVHEAEIIGTDPRTDLAVIKINAKHLQPAILGDSDALRVGEWVLAIGSPFSESLAHTVTAGIVSAKGRTNVVNNLPYENFIQTDAAINPGNSGGALVNIRGELVGINTAIATSGAIQGNIGIGFAIPINLAKRVMSDLIAKGKVTRAWLGIIPQDVDDKIAKAQKLESNDGAIIAEVVPKSPAAEAGLKVGDVIIEFEGQHIRDAADLRNRVSTSEVGKIKELKIVRNGKEQVIKVKLGELPEVVEATGRSTERKTNKLGFTVEDISQYLAKQYGIDADETGVIVTRVDPNSNAARILKPGDIIKRVADQEVTSVKEFNAALSEFKGDVLLLLIKRDKATFFETLEIK
jgi:serine protease Do